MRKVTRRILQLVTASTVLLLMAAVTSGQRARASAPVVTNEHPLFSEYKGVRLGTTAQEVRAKLGSPTLKADDQDYYMFSESESAQFAYDSMHKVVTISVDISGAGAPDYHNVVGPTIDQMEDGSLYRLNRYEAQGFWVSYSRTAGTNATVTITIQKIFPLR